MPPEEQQKFATRECDKQEAGVVMGADNTCGVDPTRGMSKTALKNHRRNSKRKDEMKAEAGQEAAPNGVNAEEAAVDASAGNTARDAATVAGDDAAPVAKVDKSAANGSSAKAPVADSGNELDKKLKALRKRLRQIEDLAQKQAEGTVLNADQQAKVTSKDEIAGEIAKWETLGDVDIQKKVKGLKKKVRQIEEYEQLKSSGKTLNADQLGKVEGKSKLMDELALVESMMEKL